MADERKAPAAELPSVFVAKERYTTAGPNRICVISDRQTIHLTMGSCVSTVFVARGSACRLAANHIVIAKKKDGTSALQKSAQEQIDAIIGYLSEHYGREDIRCIHLIGGGKKHADEFFSVHSENVAEATAYLQEKGYPPLLADTGSYCTGLYSLSKDRISVLIENNTTKSHRSFIIHGERLFDNPSSGRTASALDSDDELFETLVRSGIISDISGGRT